MFKLLNSSGITESGESEKVLLLMESGVRLHTTAYVRLQTKLIYSICVFSFVSSSKDFDFSPPCRDKSNTPSGFTLKLRKHIRTRRLEDVRQLGYDRVMEVGTLCVFV